MSSETGGPNNELILVDRFDSCLTLIKQGESVEATLGRFPSSAAELRSLVETLDNFRALPRYQISAAVGSTVLNQLLNQNAHFAGLENPAPAADSSTAPATAQPTATLHPPVRPSFFRFNWFGRSLVLSKPVVLALGLVLAVGLTLVLLLVATRSQKSPENSTEIAGVIQEVRPGRIVVDGREIYIVQGQTRLNDLDLKVGEKVRVTVKTVNGKTEAQEVQASIILPTVTPDTTVQLPTVTPVSTSAPTLTPPATGPPSSTSNPTVEPTEEVATPTPAPTITSSPPPPPGTESEVEGQVDQVIINNNITIVVINQHQYILDPEIVQLYGPRLAVGIYLKFKGRYDDKGRVVIITVNQINNEVIVINQPSNAGDDKNNKDHQSNGNCEAHSDKGKCNGPEDGKDKGKNANNGNANGNNKGGGGNNNKPKK